MMKKRIYIIMSSMLLLLLSGCDAILDSVYPPDVQNSVNINLDVDSDLPNNVNNNNISIALIPMEAGEINVNGIIVVEIWRNNFINYRFDVLPANAYRIFAFQDTDGNGKPGWTEPSTELLNNNGYNDPGLFDFRYSDEDSEFNANGYLGNYTGIGSYWLEKINGESGNQGYIDTNYQIQGSQILPPDTVGFHNFHINQNDVNVTINNVDFKFVDDYDEEVIFYSAYYDSNTKDIIVNFQDSNVTFNNGDNLWLEVTVEVNLNGSFFDVHNSILITFDSTDPGFYVYGITSLYRSNPNAIESFSLVPKDSDLTIESIDWKITDNYSNETSYNGNYNFNYEAGDSFSIDFGNLNYNLDDDWWDDFDMIIKFKVYYTNDTIFQQEYYINLYN